jgi:aminomethyltransferase
MNPSARTVLYDRHVKIGAKLVDFAGFQMPLHYPAGMVQEHMITRTRAGLFDISHMGRFILRGEDAVPFLQHVLTGNAEALDVLEAQYTMVPNELGGVVDDAYLFRFVEDEYLLVVNAANRDKVWRHFLPFRERFPGMDLADRTAEMCMISLQGPESKEILLSTLSSGMLPEPVRNSLSIVEIQGVEVWVSRSGYTGEPVGFELFAESEYAGMLWDLFVRQGAQPVGLGARDTLRLEAALPLYGHELGMDAEGLEIPAFAPFVGRIAVSFSPLKGDFVGRKALSRQHGALKRILDRDHSCVTDLPRRILPVAVTGKGIARSGCKVFADGKQAGWVTSGTMVPYGIVEGEGISSRVTGEKGMRAIGLALVDSDLHEGDPIHIDIRGKMTDARIVPFHLRSEAPPHARAILHDRLRYAVRAHSGAGSEPEPLRKVSALVHKAVANTVWRQQQCVNLIPSEQTPSAMTRLLSVGDPLGRYAEHKRVKAFEEAEVFYYQGTGFIAEVEALLQEELKTFLGCAEVEVRPVSGQMANAAVFSALVDYLNRADRKSEQRRIRGILNHHIIKGGHLSAQPMGALRDFVARDPRTERPAVINFPVLEENPYQTDVAACCRIIEEHKPELIIFGKSMTLHREPVEEIRALVDALSPDTIILYDMAHVLGLVGAHFQRPFLEGADLVTGSTHKTFFGTQRGIVAADWGEEDPRFELWETIQRRTFPGSVSNHHLGSLLGLLMAAYEMNHFKDPYQKQVLSNARAFARALSDCGFHVAGDPTISYTETHQVIVQVGYARGADLAERLEENNIIVNYQAAPDEEGFTASGCLRMGSAEMTRYGMKEADFERLAQWMHDVVAHGRCVKEDVTSFRKGFLEMRYCFSGGEYESLLGSLRRLT